MLSRSTLVLALLLMLVSGCEPSVDQQYSTDIVGLWRDSQSPYIPGQCTSFTFLENGEVAIQRAQDDPSIKNLFDAQEDPELLPAEKGTWKITDGVITIDVTFCNIPGHNHDPVDYKIVEITKGTLIFDTPDGRETYYRVQPK